MVPADGYVIISEGRIWASRKGQQVWKTPGQAKNAWGVHNTTFSQQFEATCRPVRFVDMETGDYLT